MPISYQTSIPFLIKGLYQGNILQTLLYQILFLFPLTTSLACDPSVLPRGVRISQNGPVLKLVCHPGLQPLEMFPSNSSYNLLIPVPSKRKFARYICFCGTSYKRINAQGIESSIFLCADGKDNHCDPLEYAAERGHLRVEGTVASWRPKAEGQPSVLYCVHGVWHRLGGGPIPYGVTVKYQQTEKSIPSATETASDRLSTFIASPSVSESYTSTTPTIGSGAEPSRTPFLPLTAPSSHVEGTTPKILSLPKIEFLPHSDSVEEPYIPPANIFLFPGSVSNELHKHLHKCNQITFYCMLAIGFIAVVSGVILLTLMYRRRTQIMTDVVKAQNRLRNTLSIV